MADQGQMDIMIPEASLMLIQPLMQIQHTVIIDNVYDLIQGESNYSSMVSKYLTHIDEFDPERFFKDYHPPEKV